MISDSHGRKHGRIIDELRYAVVACINCQVSQVANLIKIIEIKEFKLIEGEVQVLQRW